MQSTDKLLFDKMALANGHFLYTQKSDIPVTFIRIVIPVGNAHAHTENQYCDEGYFHFLEHMCFEPSLGYPDKTAYQNLLAKTGSSQNAWTDAFFTAYMFETPAEMFQTSFPAFLDHIISPAFNGADILLQKNIIKNERTQRKYFPGFDELSHYALTKWMNGSYYTKDQLFGSDESLRTITSQTLKNIHTYYFNKPISIFIAGTFDTAALIELLSTIPYTASEVSLKSYLLTPSWNTKEYHEYVCAEIDTPAYHLGGIFNEYKVETVWGLEFILQLLTHEEFGTLHTWIRKEKGWSYGLEPDIEIERDRMVWGIKIPTNSVEVVQEIRNEIHTRIEKACNDNELITDTKNRLLLQACFDYETITSRLDKVVNSLYITGYITTEQDYKNWLSNTVNESYIKGLYSRYFTKDVIGEFLAIPKG